MKKSLSKSIFKKKLILFLAPLLMPLIILGSLSIIITLRYVKEEINKNNLNFLEQTKQNIELMLSELDSLSLNFNTNPRIIVDAKKVLNSQYMSFEQYALLSSIKNYIDAPANARPYIHSIYIYFENEQKKLITTQDRIVELSSFHDQSWYTSYLNHKSHSSMWSEKREIQRYSFEESTEVITIYKKLDSNNGVIILNILPKFLENSFEQLNIVPNQALLILNENNDILFNINSDNITEKDMAPVIMSEEKFFSLSINNEASTVFQVFSDRYNWRYISIVPIKSLYRTPQQLIIVTIFLLIISLILGIILTYHFTKKNYKLIQNMLNIIDSAEKGSVLPSLPAKITDEYEYITHNILKTFLEQSYLKIQLSERKYKLKTMELLALQSQLNPHFLYNTLETIYWKTLKFTGTPNEVNKMLEHLSDILKYSLSNPESSVSILEEITHTKNYIAILKHRYKDKFDVIWELDSGIEHISIIKLILQPLIENCIYHGIKEKNIEGLIKIKIYLKTQYLHIVIIDNGLGIKKDKLIKIKEQLANNDDKDYDYYEHIGLFNTNKRIKLTYGNDFGIHINSRYSYGTVIKILIPTFISPSLVKNQEY